MEPRRDRVTRGLGVRPVSTETIRLPYFTAAYICPESADIARPVTPESPLTVALTVPV